MAPELSEQERAPPGPLSPVPGGGGTPCSAACPPPARRHARVLRRRGPALYGPSQFRRSLGVLPRRTGPG